jgi:hypothetical protein
VSGSPRGLAVRRALAALLALVVVVAWLAPYDVPRFVAKQDVVLLGRYTVGIFTGLVVGSALLLLVAGLLASRRTLGEAAGLLLLVGLSVSAGASIVSLWSYEEVRPRYLRMAVAEAVPDPALRASLRGSVMTRQPGLLWKTVRRDEPPPGRSYPQPAKGFPERRIELTTDERGLRNPEGGSAYDLVVAGDSFTEGSMVDDRQTWWSRLSERTGLRIYNVAVSGLQPLEYLNNFAAFGLDRQPRTAIFAVYEGNDFKGHEPRSAEPPPRPGLADRALGWLEEDSPIRGRLQRLLVDRLAPVGADRPLPAGSGLDWMPVPVKANGSVHHYAFEPRDVLGLALRDDFGSSREWRAASAAFEAIAALTAQKGVRLVFLYIPSKEHVVLPLVREQIAPEALRDFLALGARDELPPPGELAETIYAGLDSRENVMRAWCRERGIEMHSATQPLRERMARGEQVYFTYDQHWTELGHAAVGEGLARSLASR